MSNVGSVVEYIKIVLWKSGYTEGGGYLVRILAYYLRYPYLVISYFWLSDIWGFPEIFLAKTWLVLRLFLIQLN